MEGVGVSFSAKCKGSRAEAEREREGCGAEKKGFTRRRSRLRRKDPLSSVRSAIYKHTWLRYNVELEKISLNVLYIYYF